MYAQVHVHSMHAHAHGYVQIHVHIMYIGMLMSPFSSATIGFYVCVQISVLYFICIYLVASAFLVFIVLLLLFEKQLFASVLLQCCFSLLLFVGVHCLIG